MRMRPFVFLNLVLALLAASGIACRNQRVFQVKGVVREILPEAKQVRIEHEKIPGYMDAMTMAFDVREAKELAGLQPGDQVSFRMIVTDKDGWIEQIKKIGVAPPPASPPPVAQADTLRRAREVEPLKEGDIMPEYHFTNELGQPFNLSDFKGQALALSFIFTRCPYPTFCPRMSDNFAQAQKALKAMPNAPTNWHLLTLTFDPDFDTPAVLKGYAKRFEADPKHWSFGTCELIDMTAITEQFGLLFWKPDPKQPTGISHNLRTVVIDAKGRVQRILPENTWNVDELVKEMVKAAAVAGR